MTGFRNPAIFTQTDSEQNVQNSSPTDVGHSQNHFSVFSTEKCKGEKGRKR